MKYIKLFEETDYKTKRINFGIKLTYESFKDEVEDLFEDLIDDVKDIDKSKDIMLKIIEEIYIEKKRKKEESDQKPTKEYEVGLFPPRFKRTK